jgi:serine/threonine protein kinase/Tol biopolymer transport system component
MALRPGEHLGPYEILAPLGAGGMGEVYRARDPRLKRDVALKVLPAELASDPERLERFEREAQTLAALNHPHIVTIFSVEEAEDLHFLTMELVEGKALTQVISRGGLPLSRFFRIAVPLTEAVSAAHDKGIIHRDLKPGNVMVTEDGRVKVLDFGLAKLRKTTEEAMDSRSPTEPATGPGRILGTAPYMSPEQVQGQALDHRSDVFSLGIILYEMATGERPFTGETWAEVASSILRDTPLPVTERRSDLPRDLGRLVKRCLEKEPPRRVQSVLDLRNELEELKQESDSGVLLSADQVRKARAPRRGPPWLWAAAALAIVGVIVAGWLSLYRPEVAEPPRTAPITSYSGYESEPALSPDGRQVAFVWDEGGDETQHLYVQLIDGGDPLALTKDDVRDHSPAWSPDGNRVAFLREREGGGYEVREIPALGGATRRLGVAAGRGLSWSPNGTTLAVVDSVSADEPFAIFLLSVETGEKRRMTSPSPADSRWGDSKYPFPPGDSNPAFSPDGRSLAFLRMGLVEGNEIRVQPLDTDEAALVASPNIFLWDVEWASDGSSLLFSTGPTRGESHLMRVPVSGGPPSRLLVGEGARSLSVVGDRLAYAQWRQDTNIWRASGPAAARKTTPTPFITSTRDDRMPAYSPDGTQIAFISDRAGTWEVWVCDADGARPRQLSDLGHAVWPRWSPSGRQIAFSSMPEGLSSVFVLDASGGLPELRLKGASPDWSADEDRFYILAADGSIAKVPVHGGQPVQLVQSGVVPQRGPKGRVLYWRWSDERVWSVSEDGGQPAMVLEAPLRWGQWCVWNGNVVFIQGNGETGPSIKMLDLATRQTTDLASLGAGTIPSVGLNVSPDGQWILFTREDRAGSDLMLVENFR